MENTTVSTNGTNGYPYDMAADNLLLSGDFEPP